jgi:hypothetical protein
MDMTGEQRIPAPRDEVWAALNDADVLHACIPGCQELIKRSDTEMTALTILKVGPISAKFTGAVTLSDIDPPNGYRITGEGQGGGAGNASGGAVVRLREDGDETILTYEVEAQISGKLAQLGGRMIDATAKSMSTAFFKKLAAEIDARRHGTGGAPAEAAPAKAGAGRAGPAAVPSAAPPEYPPAPGLCAASRLSSAPCASPGRPTSARLHHPAGRPAYRRMVSFGRIGRTRCTPPRRTECLSGFRRRGSTSDNTRDRLSVGTVIEMTQCPLSSQTAASRRLC